MQMMRLHVTRQNPAETKMAKNEDLDEKIRRIREENKKREERFKEVEQDKKLAMKSEDSNVCTDKAKPLKNTTMKGVQSSSTKRTTKGRGQRLKEMSNHPLKAEHFKSKTKSHWGCPEPDVPQKITLINNCRSSIREKIKTKCVKQLPNVSEVGSVKTQENDDSSKMEDILGFLSEDQCTALKEHQQGDEIIKYNTSIKLQDDQQKFQAKADGKILEDYTEFCKKEQNKTKTDQIIGNIDKEENVTDTDTNKSPTHVGAEQNIQKNDKPQLKVAIKKTVSSSSFEESMTMLSPLDLPQNWGDIDFSDDDLPAPSIWDNYN